MKTRDIFAVIGLLTLVGFTGCKSDEELAAKPAKEVLQVVEGRDVVMRSGDETRSVAVAANCGWQMQLIQDDNNPWNSLSVQPQRGSGNGTLVIMSDQNTSIYDRLDTIMLTSDGGLRQKIALRQKSGDPTMNISAKTLSFTAFPSGAQLLTINSNDGWTIQTPAGIDWLHLDKTSGAAGAQTVNVSVDPIQSDVARSTSFAILYGTSSAEVLVKQAGMGSEDIMLQVSSDQLEMSGGGGEQLLSVESNAKWRAFVPSSAQSWLKVEPAEGFGHSEVKVWCESNPDRNRERLSLVVFVAGSQNPVQRDVLIQQKPWSEQQDSIHHDDYQPVVNGEVNMGDLRLHNAENTQAELSFLFHSTGEVEDYGVVWSTSNQTPTYDDGERVVADWGGTGQREAICRMENLRPGTYYVRGYVRTFDSVNPIVYTRNVVTFTIQ